MYSGKRAASLHVKHISLVSQVLGGSQQTVSMFSFLEPHWTDVFYPSLCACGLAIGREAHA